MATLGAAPTAPTTSAMTPDVVALPQALQQQLQTQTPPPADHSPQQQQQMQSISQPTMAYDPLQDAELARFLVDVGQPAQTPGFAPQTQQAVPAPQSALPGGNPYAAPTPAYGQQTIDPAALQRIELAQQQMLTALQANAAPAPGPALGQTPGPQPGALDFSVALQAAELTPEERQFFSGKEELFTKLMQNVAKEQIEPVLKRIADNAQATYGRLGEVERNTVTQQQQTTRQVLAARIPDFEQILAQPQFATFLNEVVPEVGVTRGEIVRAAVKRGDIGLIGTHVARYKQMYGQAPDGSQAMQTFQQPAAQSRAPQPAAGAPQRRVTEDTLMQAEAEMLKGRLAPDKFTALVAVYRNQMQVASQAAAPTPMTNNRLA